MKKSNAGRKPKNGIAAMTDKEKQSGYRLRKKQDLANAAENIHGGKTDALLKVLLNEFTKIDNKDAGDLSMIRKVIVELSNRYEIPIEEIEYDAHGLIDIDDDAVKEIEELRNDKKRLERLRFLISMHQSELDAVDSADKEAVETRKCMEIVLELLYNEFNRIS